MIPYIAVPCIELDQLVMAFPTFIPETVMIIGIPVERDLEPILILRIPLLGDHILKSPETASYMIKDTVEHDLKSFILKGLADFLEIIIGSQSRIDSQEILRVVTVIITGEQRIKQHTGCTKILDVWDHIQHFKYLMFFRSPSFERVTKTSRTGTPVPILD